MIICLPKRSKHSLEGNVMDVDVTSHGTTYKGLSPFFLGPYTAPDGRIAQNMENLWQYSKVYPEHIGLYENVTKKWIEWSNAGFESRKAERYPMGKGAVPKFSVWGYKRLSYIEHEHTSKDR